MRFFICKQNHVLYLERSQAAHMIRFDPVPARAGFIQLGSMAEYFMLNVLRRILEVNQLIIQFSHQRDNTPAIFDLLWFDADLTVQLLSVQREYLYQIFGMQVLLAFLWIIFFE